MSRTRDLIIGATFVVPSPTPLASISSALLEDNPEGTVLLHYTLPVTAGNFNPANFSITGLGVAQFVLQHDATSLDVQALAWSNNLVVGQVVHFAGTVAGVKTPDQGTLQ